MQTIIAAFQDQTTAERAIESLVDNGFSRSAVHLQSGYSGMSDTGTSSSASTSGASPSATPGTHDGFFAGVEHFFGKLFGDQADDSPSHAGHYTQAVRQGRSVVAVDAMSDEQVDEATSLLNGLGAIHVDEQGGTQGGDLHEYGNTTAGTMGAAGAIGAGTMGAGAMGAGTMGDAGLVAGTGGTGMTAASGDIASSQGLSDAGQTVLPVVEEELLVGKRMVDRGGIRVVKRVSETPVSEMVHLREERAVVERRPVDRAVAPGDLDTFQEGTIEVREQGEEAVVGKTARVVEEVVVGKQVTERDETVSDTVRRTDVDVETIGTQGSSTSTRVGSVDTGVRGSDLPDGDVR